LATEACVVRESLESTVVGIAVLLGFYAYVLYPALLFAVGGLSRRRPARGGDPPVPPITITLTAFNEAGSLAGTLDALLAVDYPRQLVQILVISDASDDGTDDIVRGYADRGVELLRLSRRMGKTAAENEALPYLRGDLVVNTDAAVRVHPAAVRALVAALADPTVGIASGRDVSIASAPDESNRGESAYVGYEMWVRELETRAGGIVGASGCLFAIRRDLHEVRIPPDSFRDFAAPCIAHEQGFRAVSVRDAVCYVPRTASLRAEYRRKVRTVARGLSTLWRQRARLSPLRGGFGWKLFSHKFCRWLLPWAALPALVVLLLADEPWVRSFTASAVAAAGASVAVSLHWPSNRVQPAWLAVMAAATIANVAVLHASLKVLLGDRTAIWEPTRRRVGTTSI
jgi:cellulose synthase/poly-beta-1,6-N-acetylglucosamine synthase-like glycosyltransferase